MKNAKKIFCCLVDFKSLLSRLLIGYVKFESNDNHSNQKKDSEKNW